MKELEIVDKPQEVCGKFSKVSPERSKEILTHLQGIHASQRGKVLEVFASAKNKEESALVHALLGQKLIEKAPLKKSPAKA